MTKSSPLIFCIINKWVAFPRICENPECRELFNDGFMMENICENYCSEHCAEKAYPEIKKED